MKSSENIQTLEDLDTIVIPRELLEVYHKCCDCGLWHHIAIEHKDNGDIWLTIERLDKEPFIDGYQRKLEVIKDHEPKL